MPDYAKGKVYKITGGGLTYIGSTTQTLSQRLAGHTGDYKRFQTNKSKFVSSFDLLDFPDCCITLIEDVNCERKEQLLAKERYWIEITNCVNRHKRPIASIEEKSQQKYEYQVIYKTENKEAINARDRLYNATVYNEKRKQITKNYHMNHIEDVKARQYKKMQCECGSTYVYQGQARHYRTAKHINFLNTAKNDEEIN
jgi:hypothetical protein